MRVTLLALFVACVTPPDPEPSLEVRSAALSPPNPESLRRYTIWLGGARVGTATERETWTPAGVHLRREEQLHFLRGDADVAVTTTIDIDANPALVASHVTMRLRQGDDAQLAEAVRGGDGWRVMLSHGGALLAPDAVPAELVPLLVRRDRRFVGDVFLPGRDFLAGAAHLEPVAARRLVARVALVDGPLLESTIDLDEDGLPARVVDGEGVIAMRASQAEAAAAFPAVDLIAATSLPISGRRRGQPPRIVLAGELAVPPVPGQLARPSAAGIVLELDRRLPGELPARTAGIDRRAEIAALVSAVRARITPDLAAPRVDPLAATAGDCTTFALAYAALAQARGIPTRVVTGLRVDRDRLVRHRWAVSWTGRGWIAVDAAFGAVPAGGDLVGLAVHDADNTGLVAGDAALTRVRAAAWE